jgi:hypothetical protein
MSKTLEAPFKMKLLKFFNDQEGCVMFTKEAGSIRGLPDLMGVWHGVPLYLEVKREEKGLLSSRATLQRHWINKLNGVGAWARFIYPENAEFVLRQLADEMYNRGLYQHEFNKLIRDIEYLTTKYKEGGLMAKKVVKKPVKKPTKK